MSEWQPIETAPRDGTLILVFRPYKRGPLELPNVSSDCYVPFNDAWLSSTIAQPPTHWQPLPDPPVGG